MSPKTRVIFMSSVLGIGLTLAGCQGGGAHDHVGYDNATPWGNFKCHASDTQSGRVSVGWASNEPQARDNAVAKCQGHTATVGTCKITDCANEI
jgi:hypothetical protein